MKMEVIMRSGFFSLFNGGQAAKNSGTHAGYAYLVNNRCDPKFVPSRLNARKGGEIIVLVKTQP